MAKKSNKTEHVLKLITKNDEVQDDDFFVMSQELSENGAIAAQSAVQAEPETSKAETKPEPEPEKEMPPEEPEEPEEPSQQETESPTLRAFREQENTGSAYLEQNDDLINIAEILAREKITLVMERMKVCTCKTCMNDVLALALNSLPTKYVTTDAGKQYFQLDVYKKQYETDILAALTKACVRVKATPRH